ncbi:uncharacterized protein LAJ45_11369 [Morchella importuna]|uniref:Uncharacterized protein n=1 Tax=Morchella conica CCBAS932 TaxID=1392247 RepID=A0A3N4KCV2_9PEZI|nr:uncharacterized protein LAJ45_11369 [Morchella importuna]KAH8144601.1 hypothetical protein LAJ45_11369 [Morchella importuna]RPB08336.1 hypothetical protein P167DRAFT_578307 [Morchella conica CCBAS932]
MKPIISIVPFLLILLLFSPLIAAWDIAPDQRNRPPILAEDEIIDQRNRPSDEAIEPVDKTNVVIPRGLKHKHHSHRHHHGGRTTRGARAALGRGGLRRI